MSCYEPLHNCEQLVHLSVELQIERNSFGILRRDEIEFGTGRIVQGAQSTNRG